MSDRFETRQDAPRVTAEDVVAAARRFFPGRGAQEARRLGGGFRNANYLVELAGGEKVVVRVTAAATGERAVLQLARQHGIAAPEVIREGEVAGLPALALSYIEGMPLDVVLRERPNIALGAITAAGRAIAAVHAVQMPRAGFFEARGEVQEDFPPFPVAARQVILDSLSGRAGARLGSELSERVRHAVATEWHLVEATDPGPRLTHCDFNPKNLILRPDGQVALIDWEFAMAAHPFVDLGNFFRFAPEDYPEGAYEAFVRGYGEKLPPRWERAAALLDLVSLSQFLDHEAEYPKTFHTARVAIEALTEGPEPCRPR